MRIIIQRENGSHQEALLLTAGRDRMRVVLRRTADTAEFSAVAGHWRDERGRPIEIEAVLAIDGVDQAAIRPRTRTA